MKASQTKANGNRQPLNELCRAMQEEDSISPELEEHLIGLYFSYENPWFPVVDEKLFRQGRVTESRYFSFLLLNSILALGCRYDPLVELRSDPDDSITAGHAFVEKAEVLLHFDLKWPSISTIQSLAILGTVYVVSSIPALRAEKAKAKLEARP